jgi:hypothetical protein
MQLERSDGHIVDSPDEEEVRGAVQEVGEDLDYCILSDEEEFIQVAVAGGGLVMEYHDESGQYESEDTDLPVETVIEAFIQFLNGEDDWKGAVDFIARELSDGTYAERFGFEDEDFE